jgi:hypothetical protein
MPRKILATDEDWKDAADDAYSHISERPRGYDTKKSLILLDDLTQRGQATQEEMIAAHGHSDFIATVLGHVTVAVHGPGYVPKSGGWYASTSNPTAYVVNPRFAEAWKTKRRLT